MPLSADQLNNYKHVLEQTRASLLRELEMAEKQEDFGADVDALDEEADEAEERGNRIAVAQTIRDRINEIDHALSKIASGAYGACERCGREISESVLALVPESRLCADCKKAQQ